MTVNKLAFMTLEEVSALIEKREISPVDLTRDCLENIEKHNPVLNAYVYTATEESLRSAKAAEEEISHGNYRGRLHGIPISFKDLYYTKNMPTTACSQVLLDFVPSYNATVVDRFLDAGAINLGKTNTTEFAFGPTNEESYFGPARNPWNPKKISGGSSGGSAVAVASGMAFVSMGADSGGSIRIPAAMCGVVGFKPSIGLVSTYGIIQMSPTMDHLGPICRSVADVAITLDTITGTDEKDPCPYAIKGSPTNIYNSIKNKKDLSGKVFGIPKTFFFDKTDYEAERVFYEAIDRIKALGGEVREVTVPFIDFITEGSTNIMFKEAADSHRRWYPSKKELYQKDIPPRIEIGLAVTEEEYITSRKYREQIIAGWDTLMKELDAVLVPTCPIEPFDIGLGSPWSITTRGRVEDGKPMATYHTRLANVTGAPALSVPAGLTKNNLPIGLMIMGARGDDLGVLEIGLAYERSYKYPIPQLNL